MSRRLSQICRFGAAMATAFALSLGSASAQAPAAPSGNVLRNRLHIVSSGSADSITTALVDQFMGHYVGVERPQLDIIGSAAALNRFCAGVGPTTPDLALTTRRMPHAVFETCQQNDVTDIIEVRLGWDALVVAVRRGDSITNLTMNQIYRALAAELADDDQDDFRANQATTWSQINNSLPATQIRAVIPDRNAGSRGVFNDLVMEGGCREVKAIRLIFSAPYRVSKCTGLRGGNLIREMPAEDVASALLASPPGTIGVLSYGDLLASGGNLVPVSINGVVPTPSTIASHDYDLSRTVYIYAKRSHTRSRDGIGVVRGVTEFLTDSVSETMIGPGGMLSRVGIVPRPPAERNQQRDIVARQTLFTR